MTNSSSSEDEAGQSSSNVIRRRRVRRNTSSIVTEPEEEEALESGPSEEVEEDMQKEEKQQQEEDEEEEPAEVGPAVDVGVQGQGGSVLKCILLALVIAFCTSFGQFYGKKFTEENIHAFKFPVSRKKDLQFSVICGRSHSFYILGSDPVSFR